MIYGWTLAQVRCQSYWIFYSHLDHNITEKLGNLGRTQWSFPKMFHCLLEGLKFCLFVCLQFWWSGFDRWSLFGPLLSAIRESTADIWGKLYRWPTAVSSIVPTWLGFSREVVTLFSTKTYLGEPKLPSAESQQSETVTWLCLSQKKLNWCQNLKPESEILVCW